MSIQHPLHRSVIRQQGWFLLLILSLQLVSLRAIWKYIPFPALACMIIFFASIAACYYLVRFIIPQPFFSSPYISLALSVLLFLINGLVYPKADSLKWTGRGSDADDAVIQAATRLFQGRFPYTELTYLNHPISPGPGMLLFTAPFVLTHTFVLAVPFFVSLFVWACMRISHGFKVPNFIFLVLFSSLGFWEYMFIGSDLIIVSILIALLTGLIVKYEKNFSLLLMFSLCMGITLTSRVTLIYYIPFLTLILLKRNQKAALIFGLSSFVTCLGLHAAFYFRDPAHYTPFHLLHKGSSSTNVYILAASFISTVWVLVSLLTEKSLDDPGALKYAWLALAIPHFFIGLGMLVTDHFKFANSEGPGYLLIQLFPFLLFFTYRMRKERIGHDPIE